METKNSNPCNPRPKLPDRKQEITSILALISPGKQRALTRHNCNSFIEFLSCSMEGILSHFSTAKRRREPDKVPYPRQIMKLKFY